jgi:hypothetical protein
LRTRLDVLHPSVGPTVDKAVERQRVQYDQLTRVIQFKPRQPVWVRFYSGARKWRAGKIIQQTGPLSYDVEVGRECHSRHTDQLRARVEGPDQSDEDNHHLINDTLDAAADSLVSTSKETIEASRVVEALEHSQQSDEVDIQAATTSTPNIPDIQLPDTTRPSGGQITESLGSVPSLTTTAISSTSAFPLPPTSRASPSSSNSRTASHEAHVEIPEPPRRSDRSNKGKPAVTFASQADMYYK